MSKQHLMPGAWAVAAIMATGVAGAALPQQTSNDPAGSQPAANPRSADWNQNRGRAMAGRTDVDHFLIKVVLQANRDEIATGRLADQRSTNQDVKKFAMQMVEDHTRFMNRLQQFQGQRPARPGNRRPASSNFNNNGVNNNGVSNAPVTTPPATSQAASDTANDHNATNGTLNNGAPVVGQATPAPAYNQAGTSGQRFGREMAGQRDMRADHSAAHQFVQIMDQVAEQTQRSVQRELSQKEGAQFDRCFLSWQVLDHVWLVDALTVFERSASPALQPILQEGLQTSQQHLAHAKALLARIEQGQSKSAAQQTPSTLERR